MNVLLLAFILQIFGLYVMILVSDYALGLWSSYRDQRRLRRSPVRIRRK
jgi:hypothetical protein